LVRRVDLKHLAEVGDGAVNFALLPVGDAPVGVGDGIIRVERDGLVVFLVAVALIVLGG
jgi:RNase P/RNase MRP subunit POP5